MFIYENLDEDWYMKEENAKLEGIYLSIYKESNMFLTEETLRGLCCNKTQTMI